jgi:ABC-type antimicrobial peptide transport system permease subunit
MIRAMLNAARSGAAEIWAHKTRSVLSFLAIAVGSVVFIDAFSAIFHTYERLEKQREFSGLARMRIIQNQAASYSSPDDYVEPPAFGYEELKKLRAQAPEFYMVSGEARSWRNVMEYGGERVVASVAGVTPEWMKRDFGYTLRGRFINSHDMEEKLRVCVLIRKAPPPPGEKIYRKVYSNSNAFDTLVTHQDLLGKAVSIDGITFTVIGVAEEFPHSKRLQGFSGWREQTKVLVPVTTGANYGIVRGGGQLEVSIDAGDEAAFDDALRKVNNFLKVTFGDGDFFVVENQLEEIRKNMAARLKDAFVTISLGMLAFIAGGIGIMNVTLATVFARTKEIGIRRAVGASRSDIMLQFVVEAVLLGLIGGVLGSALGWLWGVPLKVILGMGASPIKPWMPLISVLIAAVTAFSFAIYPAWVAAGLKPADALRTE